MPQPDIFLGFANFLSVWEGTLKPVSPSGFRREGQQNFQRARLSKTPFKIVSNDSLPIRMCGWNDESFIHSPCQSKGRLAYAFLCATPTMSVYFRLLVW